MPQIESAPTDAFDVDAARGSRGFLSILWQRKALLILGAVLGLLVGALVYWQRPAVYQANAQILVIKRSNPIAVGNDPRLAIVDDYMAVHLVVLRSPAIIERAVTKKNLAALKTFEDSGDPVGQILGSFSVARDKDVGAGPNSVLLLSFRGPVADDCTKVLTAIIESYQDFLDVKYRSVSDETLILIQKAQNVLKGDLAESEQAYLKFRQDTSLFWKNKEGVNVQLERVVNLEKKRTEKSVLLEELKNRIEFLEKALKEGTTKEALLAMVRDADGKAMASNKAMDDQLLPLLIAEKQLLETYGENSAQVISQRRRIALVRDHYEKSAVLGGQSDKELVQRHIRILREGVRETELNVQSLGTLLTEAKESAKHLSNFELQEEYLHNDVIRKRELYHKTVEKVGQMNLVRDSGGFDTQSLSLSPTGIKVAPSALQMILAGLMVGLLAGVGLAYLADLTDKSFRNPDEVRLRLGLPLLGHVPFLQPDPEAAKKAEAGELAIDPMLLALFRPKSLEAEAYRAIRTALYFGVQGEGHRVLQVSSPNKSDGKSLMVGNLAVSMAQSGKKLLVIDADCRRPRQHKLFNLTNTHGLSNVLAQGADWRGAVQVTPVDGLWIMPSGPIPPNPAELLSSPRFAELLETVRPDFDYVIVDTPPLLAVTDPCVVAGRVDGLVLVLRLSRQGRPHAERARQILLSLGVKVLGVVVNGVTRQSGTGIYSSEHYDYAESYEQTDDGDGNDGYYYHEEETPPPAKK